MTAPPPLPSVPPDSPGPAQRPRPAEGWVLLLSFGVSLVLHLLLIVLYPVAMARLAPDPLPPDEEVPRPFRDAPEVVFLQEVPDLPDEVVDPPLEEEEPEPEEELEEAPVPLPEVPVAPAEEADVAEEEEEERALTPAERLRPRMDDPRLWIPVDPEHTDMTPEERAELLVRGLIQDWNDSVAIAEAVAAAGLDWTITDEEGRRWGVSPGTLHLGNFSIPLPFQFQMPGYMREEAEFRQWQWEDIRRGAAAQQVREEWAERAQEIRRRLEQERADSLQMRR